jgi:hypothetical protein
LSARITPGTDKRSTISMIANALRFRNRRLSCACRTHERMPSSTQACSSCTVMPSSRAARNSSSGVRSAHSAGVRIRLSCATTLPFLSWTIGW